MPFRTHHESCLPVHGTIREGAPPSLTIQFYAPVKPQDPTKIPVKVYRYSFGTFHNEVDITDDFSATYPSDRKQIVVDGAQFRPHFRYRVVPITSNPGTGETLLLCDDLLTSSDVPVYGEDYFVDVTFQMSMLDLSDNQWVDEPDAAIWLNDPQDFDGDGAADANDLVLITENLGEPVD